MLVLAAQHQVQVSCRKVVGNVGMLQEKSSDNHLPDGDERNLVLLVEGASTDMVAAVFCRFPYSTLQSYLKMGMCLKLGIVFSVFTIRPKFPFPTFAHLSCCSCNIRLSLSISYLWDCKSSHLPEVS